MRRMKAVSGQPLAENGTYVVFAFSVGVLTADCLCACRSPEWWRKSAKDRPLRHRILFGARAAPRVLHCSPSDTLRFSSIL